MLQRLFGPKTGVETSAEQYLIVGLGNPGREYRETRHNLGFMALDALSKRVNIPMTKVQSKALIGTGSIAGKRVILPNRRHT